MRLFNIYPKWLVVLFFVFFFKELVKVSEVNHFYFADYLAEIMHEMPTSEDRTVSCDQLIIENFLKLAEVGQQVYRP